MEERQLNSPDSYERDMEIDEPDMGRCANCKDHAPLYLLDMATGCCKHTDMVCSYCLNELHNNPEL